jgi:hypothetical protein
MKRKILQLKIICAAVTCAFLVLFLMPGYLFARDMVDPNADALRDLNAQLKPTATGVPNTQLRVHKVGNMLMAITNWGFFGSQIDEGFKDPETDLLAPSCEYPAGSGIEYLFQGALWIGAIVEDDTLVSVGADGWQHINEMYPDEAPDGDIEKRSIRPTDANYHPDAVSEADYIAIYTDTLTDRAYVPEDPMDRRPHQPLNIKVLQKSYSWSYKYAEDFILFDFLIHNMGLKSLRKVFMGIYIDADVMHPEVNPDGFNDDITGFRWTYTRPDGLVDTIRTAWIADCDGDPVNNAAFDRASPIAVTGTRVVRTPNPDLQYAFNWWVSEQYNPAQYDWGPMMADNYRDYGTGGLGTPEGDRNKYYILSNNEFDYDQIYSAMNFVDQGWLPPPASDLARELADGYDTRYLISFGPFNIEPGDSLPITMAYVAGDNFHNKPDDFRNFYDMNNPEPFGNVLDFSDLGLNSTWAAWVYDNPGVDTDGDGIAGDFYIVEDTITGQVDTIYTSGDGKPDFEGPPPPPAPVLRYSAVPGKVTVKWNGQATEQFIDPFSGLEDFEGYRVYMSDDLIKESFALLTSNDLIDYNRFVWDVGKSKWFLKEVPFSLDSLKALFGEDFDPMEYDNQDDPFEAPDGTLYYFENSDWNRYFSDGRGMQKTYQLEIDAGTVTDSIGIDEYPDNYVHEGDSVYHKYWEYKYEIENLLPSQAKYFAVTAFDFGNPQNDLEPLESSPLSNAIRVFPVYSADQVEEQGIGVSVYPNPYRSDAGYARDGYEGSDLHPERERRIHFINLPERCTIKIWTTDGDLAREIEHYPGGPYSDTNSKAHWDMISRNTQAIVSGLYIYSIESESGTQIGKLVIIK